MMLLGEVTRESLDLHVTITKMLSSVRGQDNVVGTGT